MKLAFISDIHSNIHAFYDVLKKIQSLSIDEVFCIGDIVGYAAYPKECVDLLFENDIISIMGNHDYATVKSTNSWFDQPAQFAIDYCKIKLYKKDLKLLVKLPFNKLFDRDGVSFFITHGSPRDNLFEYVHPWASEDLLKDMTKKVNADVIVLGHTHIQMEVEINKKKILNPGSVGQPRDGISKACFMVFDTEDLTSEWFRIKYDINSAVKGIFDNNLPEVFGKRLFEGK